MNFGARNMLFNLIWILPGLVIFLFFVSRDRAWKMERFVEGSLIPRTAPRLRRGLFQIRNLLSALAVVLFVLALSRPQWGEHWRDVEREGLDIVFAVDTSRSMLARDLNPNRMGFVKKSVEEFVKGFGGHRLGLVAFAGEAFLQCPLTSDHAGFLLVLRALDENTVPRGGTAIAEAVEKAIESFQGAAGNNRIVFLISDGEDHEGGLDAALGRARSEKVTIHTVGVGSPEGSRIPVLGDRGEWEYLKDREGRIVETKLNEDMLRKIAERTGGSYRLAHDANSGLEEIYAEHIYGLDGAVTESRKVRSYTERFYYPLSLAVLLLIVELFLRSSSAKEM